MASVNDYVVKRSGGQFAAGNLTGPKRVLQVIEDLNHVTVRLSNGVRYPVEALLVCNTWDSVVYRGNMTYRGRPVKRSGSPSRTPGCWRMYLHQDNGRRINMDVAPDQLDIDEGRVRSIINNAQRADRLAEMENPNTVPPPQPERPTAVDDEVLINWDTPADVVEALHMARAARRGTNAGLWTTAGIQVEESKPKAKKSIKPRKLTIKDTTFELSQEELIELEAEVAALIEE